MKRAPASRRSTGRRFWRRSLSENEQERIAQELAEELRKLRVEDVLVNTLVHVSSIGYRRLGLTEESSDERDLPQSALAIETMTALVHVVEGFLPEELVDGFEEQIANLQLAYAKAVREAGGDADG
jgi:hypothetical protein